MTEPVYEQDRVVGHLVDGEFQPLPPVPEGAAFDSLVDDVCNTIEQLFKDHLDPDYRPCHGQHSSFLMTGHHHSLLRYSHEHGGVESWVKEGTLRSTDALAPVLNAFVAEKRRLVRMRKLAPDWQTTRYDFQVLGSKFGLPTPEELERQSREKYARQQQEQEERRRLGEEEAERNRPQWEREYAQRQRINSVTNALVDMLVGPVATEEEAKKIIAKMGWKTMDVQGYRANDMLERSRKHREVEPLVKGVVEQTTFADSEILNSWGEGKKEYLDTLKYVDDDEELFSPEVCAANFILRKFAEVGVLTSSEIPPLAEGAQRRTFATKAALLAFCPEWYGLLETNTTSLTMSPDGMFILDVLPLDKGNK